MMRVTGRKNEDPADQMHEELFTSPLGVSVTGVTTYFNDGSREFAVYLDDSANPESFNVLGVYDGTPAGEIQSQSTSYIAIRTLKVLAELKGRA